MKFYKAVAATAAYLLFLAAVYVTHVSFFRVNVVFYAAIADGLIAALLSGILLFTLRYFRAFGTFEKVQLLIIWVLVGYAFAISVPTVIDRSLSIYILEKLQQRGGEIKESRIKDIIVGEFMTEHRLVDVRLTEQLESGTIVIEDGCVKLTSRGSFIASFGRYFRQTLLPKNRLLMGEYTDDLTDPFRNNDGVNDYKCE